MKLIPIFHRFREQLREGTLLVDEDINIFMQIAFFIKKPPLEVGDFFD